MTRAHLWEKKNPKQNQCRKPAAPEHRFVCCGIILSEEMLVKALYYR